MMRKKAVIKQMPVNNEMVSVLKSIRRSGMMVLKRFRVASVSGGVIKVTVSQVTVVSRVTTTNCQ